MQTMMVKRAAVFGAALGLALGMAGLASAQEKTINVTMTGGAESPAGDPDGTGTAMLKIDPAKGQICYTLKVDKIATATAAHIHKGAAGAAGGPVVPLKAPATGSVTDCATVATAVAQDIVANPANYYVNVHNGEFPGGALRGQLGK